MALTQLKTGAIADDAVTTDKLANAINTERTANTAKVSLTDNSVTLAKMAGGTDGQIITYDASGDPVAVGPGTDGQVLTSTGAGSPPAFEAIPASGKILQVVNTLKTAAFTTTNTDITTTPRGVAVTGFTASITPSSASNKILVSLTFGLTNSNANYYAYAYLYRGTTLIGATTAISAGGGVGIQNKAIERLDAPNTTSSTTYSVRLAAEGNTAKIGEGSNGTSDDRVDDASITLMEVAA
tara:strand:+ start:192 stop:911 length:720 start_codon:yes stop_codon:yes gene_type:complete